LEDKEFIRVQEVLLPILRNALGDEVQVSSWVADIDYREYPVVNIRRLGGERAKRQPYKLDRPVIEITAYSAEGLPECEELYNKALKALFDSVGRDFTGGRGYVCYVHENMGMTQFSSLFQDTWRVQGLVVVGIRVPDQT